MLFLHGHGQRGNGLKDLDYVLTHGPLMEAWIQRKELPFIIISPQLPVKFGIPGIEEDHSADPIPVRQFAVLHVMALTILIQINTW